MIRRIETIDWRDVDDGLPAPWCITRQQSRERFASRNAVEVPACQSHAGKWIANLTHQGCACPRVTVRGVTYQF